MRAEPTRVIDESELLERVDGDRDLLRTLIALFAECSPPMLVEIAAAVASRDTARLEFNAHKLKGSAAALSACAVRDLAERLERMGAQGHLDLAAARYAELEVALAEVMPVLAALDRKAEVEIPVSSQAGGTSSR
jgi:HPt (histidine-containing phosphotransfer) domain-containing protein